MSLAEAALSHQCLFRAKTYGKGVHPAARPMDTLSNSGLPTWPRSDMLLSLPKHECFPVGPLVPREQSKPEGLTPSQAGGQPGWASLTFCPSVKHGIHQCCTGEPRVGGHQWASELSKQTGLLKEARSLEAAASARKSSHQPHSDLLSAIAKTLQTQCQVTERASTLKLDGTGLESQLP